MIFYRILTSDDLKVYKTIRLQSLLESPYSFSDSYDDMIDKDDCFYLNELDNSNFSFMIGAFNSDSELIGFVNFKRDYRTKANHKGMIHRTYVHPDYRKQGIGVKLMHNVLEFARKIESLEQIHLWVLQPENGTSNFYKKIGFRSQGTIVKRDLKIDNLYVDAEYMVLYF
ncbi:GNAT family N-acetyltransferase [uncultured Psychroserpens sp.]|uniref:GNAT family N-acetyltransferase n=1 Tax=uncultured Psychroserpens sp. TaxID=255436 RepID=UPI0026324765|nr:GNAT family N-acetyltransferase [uncultured Psychroserpens sp.]